MHVRRSLGSEERVLLDHVSREGPRVTHVRGILLINSIRNLRGAGVYEEYVRRMSPVDLDVVQSALAASWVPSEHVVAHYAACDTLGLSQAVLTRFGESAAERVASTFLAVFLRRARLWGLDAFKTSALQMYRLNDRVQRGGGCIVVERGPKDLVVEEYGLPFASSRCYREGYLAFNRAIARLFCKTVYANLVHPSVAHPHRLALSFSWV